MSTNNLIDYRRAEAERHELGRAEIVYANGANIVTRTPGERRRLERAAQSRSKDTIDLAGLQEAHELAVGYADSSAEVAQPKQERLTKDQELQVVAWIQHASQWPAVWRNDAIGGAK